MDARLLENGDFRLLESGDRRLLEQPPVEPEYASAGHLLVVETPRHTITVLDPEAMRLIGANGPIPMDPIDPDEIIPVTFDWTNILDAANVLSLASSGWEVSPGLAVGDGVTTVTKRGSLETPPAPSVDGAGRATAHIWVTTAIVGSQQLVTNFVKAGSGRFERSALTQVRQL